MPLFCLLLDLVLVYLFCLMGFVRFDWLEWFVFGNSVAIGIYLYGLFVVLFCLGLVLVLVVVYTVVVCDCFVVGILVGCLGWFIDCCFR